MRVQIVHHQHNLLGAGVMHVDQFARKVCPVDFGPSSPHLEKTLASQRFAGDKDVTVAIGIILIVDALGMAWLHGQGLPQFRDQLFAPFIQTDVWTLCIVGARVALQDLFHMVDEVGIGLWRNAPLSLQPRFQLVFFTTCRTVSWLTLSTISSSTNLSATRRRLQRSYPCGAGLHSRATRCASCSPSSLRFWDRFGGGRPLSAPSKPPSAKSSPPPHTPHSPPSKPPTILPSAPP